MRQESSPRLGRVSCARASSQEMEALSTFGSSPEGREGPVLDRRSQVLPVGRRARPGLVGPRPGNVARRRKLAVNGCQVLVVVPQPLPELPLWVGGHVDLCLRPAAP